MHHSLQLNNCKYYISPNVSKQHLKRFLLACATSKGASSFRSNTSVQHRSLLVHTDVDLTVITEEAAGFVAAE